MCEFLIFMATSFLYMGFATLFIGWAIKYLKEKRYYLCAFDFVTAIYHLAFLVKNVFEYGS